MFFSFGWPSVVLTVRGQRGRSSPSGLRVPGSWEPTSLVLVHHATITASYHFARAYIGLLGIDVSTSNVLM